MAGRIATAEEIERSIAEILQAFRGVKKGVSWSELSVIDSHGTSEERGIARARDKDKSWEDVANDAKWNPDPKLWAFFDPHGFRYYAAAAMVRALREHRNPLGYFEFTFDRAHGEWSEFNDDQVAATAEFVLAMSRLDEDCYSRREWRTIYEQHWQRKHKPGSQKQSGQKKKRKQ